MNHIPWSRKVALLMLACLLVVPAFGVDLAINGSEGPSINGKIAFEREIGGKRQIFVINPDGSGEGRLTNNSFDDANPVWSPDGAKIVFSSNRDGIWEIYVMDADGSSQINLTNGTGGANPGYSADGTKIVFASDPSHTGGDEIYVMNSDGSGLVRLTYNTAFDFDPSYSPDGSRIVFMSNRDGNYEVYVMNADGSGQTRLTDSSADDSRPSWSPDGTKIAFESKRDGYSQIYMMNTDGSGQTRITNTTHHCFNPYWSPDGAKIVFASHRDGNYDIYIMNPDGSSEARVTYDSARDIWPSWQRLFVTTFEQAGIGSDFFGDVLEVDGVSYAAAEMPAALPWGAGTSHDFSWSSPLIVSIDKRYAWSSTSGQSTGQSGDFIATPEDGAIVANYITQHYVRLIASEGGSITEPSSWVESDGNVTATPAPDQGYVFSHWQISGNIWEIVGGGNTRTFKVMGPGTVMAVFEIIDNVPPTIAVISPMNGSTVPPGNITISASYSDNGHINVTAVKLRFDGTIVATGVVLNATGITYTVPLSSGAHTAELTVEDYSGNSRVATWAFAVGQPSAGFPIEYVIAIVVVVAVVAVLAIFLMRRGK